MRLIGDGVVERGGVNGLAAALGYSPRHLNRVLTAELGAEPLALARARRATDARILIQRTSMPMSQVAFAAGFASIRQFNDTVRAVFDQSPSELRARGVRASADPDGAAGAGGALTLTLALREPYCVDWMTGFLAGHAAPGIETMHGEEYQRTLDLPHGAALASVRLTQPPERPAARVRLWNVDMRDVGVAVTRLRRLLDADADAAASDAALSADPTLAPLVRRSPGLRVPGAVDGWEMLARTIIGQQVSLAAARTHTATLVSALGRRVQADLSTDAPGFVFPTPELVAERGHEVLRGPRARTRTLVTVARAVAEGQIELHPGVESARLQHALQAMPGIGPWTAGYVVMRVLGDPDVLLSGDLVIRRSAASLGLTLPGPGRGPAGRACAEGPSVERTSQWSPWRSYASIHLWRHHLLATTGAAGCDPTRPPATDRTAVPATRRGRLTSGSIA